MGGGGGGGGSLNFIRAPLQCLWVVQVLELPALVVNISPSASGGSGGMHHPPKDNLGAQRCILEPSEAV